MIKNFFIACICSSCMCSYAGEQLNLTAPETGSLSSSSDSVISWSEDYKSLSSWRLSFDLVKTMDVDNATIFYSCYHDGRAYNNSLSLCLNSDGSVLFKAGKTVIATSESAWITLNDSVSVELEFLSLIDEEQQYVGGVFSATIGDKQLVVDFDKDNLDFKCLYNDTPTYPQPLISSAGGYVKFSNIELYKLDERQLVPEPSTVTLNFLALVALAARRRRK